jgi:hypothetical protein
LHRKYALVLHCKFLLLILTVVQLEASFVIVRWLMCQVLEEAMKECMASAKDAEHEARSILEARVRDEQEIKL